MSLVGSWVSCVHVVDGGRRLAVYMSLVGSWVSCVHVVGGVVG